MTELREIIARAIYTTRPDQYQVTECVGTTGTRADYQRVMKAEPWEDANPDNHANCFEGADAALAAIKEAGFVVVEQSTYDRLLDSQYNAGHKAGWNRAMIEAAEAGK